MFYSALHVLGDIDGAGLVAESADCVQRPVETVDGDRVALDALVRARRPD